MGGNLSASLMFLGGGIRESALHLSKHIIANACTAKESVINTAWGLGIKRVVSDLIQQLPDPVQFQEAIVYFFCKVYFTMKTPSCY